MRSNPLASGSAVTPRIPASAGGEPGTSFDQAYQTVKTTRDLATMETQVATMRQSFDALSKTTAADAPELVARKQQLDDAQGRLEALKLLSATPIAPKPVITRHPNPSTTSPSSHDRQLASSYMQAYTGQAVGATGFFSWFQNLIHHPSKPATIPAFEQLSAADRSRFLAVANRADASGQVALHTMLVAGKLTPGLLGQLQGLANAPLAAGIDATQLLSETLVELGDPATISQQQRGTCAATSIQIMTATEMPERYVQIVTDLASPAGQSKLPSGVVLKRKDDWAATNDGGRSLPSRLIQPAFMQVGDGSALTYNNTNDSDYDPITKTESPSGLTGEGGATVLDAVGLNAKGFETHGVVYAPNLSSATARALDDDISGARDMLVLLQNGQAIDAKSQDQLMADIQAQATPSKPVYTTVIYPIDPSHNRVGFHAVLVTGIKDNQVSITNPWGEEEKIPLAQFRTMALNANLPK